ncbi:hypothetical protein ACFQ0B_57810 [Nonomuraea thailandensis]
MSDAVVAIGTRKGLFLARSIGGGPFQIEPIQFSTVAVPSVAIDTRGATPRLLAGIEYGHFGPSVMYSDDLGATWQEAEQPPIAFPEKTGATLTRVWQLAPSPSEPDVVWAGSSRPRCSVPRIAGSPTSSSRGSGSTRTASSGSRAAAACACTRSSPTPPTPS